MSLGIDPAQDIPDLPGKNLARSMAGQTKFARRQRLDAAERPVLGFDDGLGEFHSRCRLAPGGRASNAASRCCSHASAGPRSGSRGRFETRVTRQPRQREGSAAIAGARSLRTASAAVDPLALHRALQYAAQPMLEFGGQGACIDLGGRRDGVGHGRREPACAEPKRDSLARICPCPATLRWHSNRTLERSRSSVQGTRVDARCTTAVSAGGPTFPGCRPGGRLPRRSDAP